MRSTVFPELYPPRRLRENVARCERLLFKSANNTGQIALLADLAPG
jgi:hypothetical protein